MMGQVALVIETAKSSGGTLDFDDLDRIRAAVQALGFSSGHSSAAVRHRQVRWVSFTRDPVGKAPQRRVGAIEAPSMALIRWGEIRDLPGQAGGRQQDVIYEQ
jgi:hypothetical protein